MSAKKKKSKRLTKKLLNKYRLVILNEDTFEEQISFKLNRLNVFVIVTLSTILLIAFTTFFIAFTPLREYIPGYSSTELNMRAALIDHKTDSLQQAMRVNNQYYDAIRKVLNGEVSVIEFDPKETVNTIKTKPDSIDLDPSEEDLRLREEVEEEDRYSLFESAKSELKFGSFFPPVQGSITDGYDSTRKHYAVDIAVAKNTPIKAIADGTIIFAEWTAETGYVMIIDHGNNLLSVYKHNSSLSKQQGDTVKTGEVVATAGSTGELSTGPHLHFELWNGGYSLNPTNFIDFE